MHFIKIYISLLIFCYSVSLEAQKALHLRKVTGKLSIYYYQNEPIKLYLKGEDYSTSGKIEGFTDSTIILHNTPIPIDEIAIVDIRDKKSSNWSLRNGSSKIIIAGLGLPLIDLLNNPGNVSKEILWTSAGLVSAGVIMNLLQRRKFAVNKRNRLQIVDY